MFDPLIIFEALGGLALFLYGIKSVTKSLEALAGASLKLILTRLTRSRWRGSLVGFATAAAVQSSGAVMLLLVGFINAGLLTLNEALGVALGAGIGTTITVQLIAFKLTRFALIIVLAGFVMLTWCKRDKVKNAGKVIFSFGLIFLGMRLMMQSMEAVHGSNALLSLVEFLKVQPFWAFILAIVLTSLFQSSAAFLGIILTLAFEGLLTFEATIPFIVGANIGSCATGIIGSINAKEKGKRVIWAELIMRIAIAILFFVFKKPIVAFLYYIGSFVPFSEARLVAIGHTFYGLVAAIIFLPFITPVARLMKKLFPAKGEEKFGPLYLDYNVLDNPPMALGQAAREVIRTGDIVFKMLEDMETVIDKNDEKLLKEIIKRDDEIDLLQEQVTSYLTKLSQHELDVSESRKELELINIVLDLEHIADIISKNISQYAAKKIEYGYYFSDEGYKEVKYLEKEVKTNLQMALDAIPMRDKEIALQVIKKTKFIVEEQRRLYRSHLERLHKGLRDSIETSTIHLDLLSDLNLISLTTSYIAYAILEKV
ncbi:Na/Pi cotransporter family protein [bacterium]|nr:Na/Pi cotransporter family protein [bacterium]